MIATCATVNSGIYEQTIHAIIRTSAWCPIPALRCENHRLPAEHKEFWKTVHECVDPIVAKDASIQYLLLGCSHFPIIKREIGELYPDLTFIDPAKAQVNLLKEYLAAHDLATDNDTRRIDLYTTAETYEFAAAIKRLKLEVDSLLKVRLIQDDD